LLARTTAGNLTLTVDNIGLRFEATLLDTSTANDAYTDIKNSLLTGMSFGFRVSADEWNWMPDGVTPKRKLTDIDLFEISATSFPAYNSTSVDARQIRSRMRTKRDDDPCDPDGSNYDPDNPDCPGEDEEDVDDRCDCRCEVCSGCEGLQEDDPDARSQQAHYNRLLALIVSGK
jgi:hypothetical protein